MATTVRLFPYFTAAIHIKKLRLLRHSCTAGVGDFPWLAGFLIALDAVGRRLHALARQDGYHFGHVSDKPKRSAADRPFMTFISSTTDRAVHSSSKTSRHGYLAHGL